MQWLGTQVPKERSATIHLDYMQTQDLLTSGKEELEIIEKKLLSSIGSEIYSCDSQNTSKDSLILSLESKQEVKACFIPKDFSSKYVAIRDNLENELDERILSSGLGFYDRDFDKLEGEEIKNVRDCSR